MLFLFSVGLNASVSVLEVISVIEEVAVCEGSGVFCDLLAKLHLGSLLHLDDDSGGGGLVSIWEGEECFC